MSHVWTFLRVAAAVALILAFAWLLMAWGGTDQPMCPDDPTYGPCEISEP